MAAQKKQNLSSEKLLQLAQEVMLEYLIILADRPIQRLFYKDRCN